MRFALIALACALAPLLWSQNSFGVYGSPQIPANSVAQGRTDYSAFAFAAVQTSGSSAITMSSVTIANAAPANPAGTADTVRIRLVRDSYPFNLSVDAGDTIVATINNPTFPVTFGGLTETLPTLATQPSPWPYFVAVDVAGVGTSTVGNVYRLSLTAITVNAIMITSLPITGEDHTIVAPTSAEMDVQRNAQSIAAGAQDNVGNRQNGSAFTLTYTILNTGSDPLLLSGNPMVEIISLSLVNCTASVTQQPTSPVAATTGSTTFSLSITPTTAGMQFGLGFIINNNDNDENPYNIVVVGDAVASVPPATQLVVTQQPGNGTAGGTLSTQPIIEARDGSGNLDTNYSANVVATITGGTGTGGANLLGTATVAASGGVAVFTNLGIDLAGTDYTLTFTSGALTQAISNQFDITATGPGPATQLVITQQPGGATGGANLSPQPVVHARDAGGATDTGFSGAVTAAITSGTGTSGAALLGTVTVNAVAGVATFTNLAIDLVGANYSLTFMSGALTQAVSNTFNITLGGPAQLSITAQPGNAAPGAPFSPQPVVAIQDAGGNTITTDSSSSISAAVQTGPTGALLTGTLVITCASGVATWTDLGADTAGTYTLRFIWGGAGTVPDATSANITVSTGGGGGGGGGGGSGDGGGGGCTGHAGGGAAVFVLMALLRRRRGRV